MLFKNIFGFFTKMRRLHTVLTLVLATLVLVIGMDFASSHSVRFYSRGNGTMVYDSNLNITWLADANYAATQYRQSCGELGTKDGKMTWTQATRWVDDLVYGGFSDWRLPTTPASDPSCDEQNPIGTYGFNCTGSEMGNLFYEGLGGRAGESIINTHNKNFDLFHNISSFGKYWLGREFAPLAQIALNFHTRNGFSNANSKSVALLVWPVRDGDVGPNAQGEPRIENPNCRKLN
jgi:hypothetical protein